MLVRWGILIMKNQMTNNKDITKEEFSEKLKNVPYEKEFKEFLERTMTEYINVTVGNLFGTFNIKIDEKGIGHITKKSR